ncbi:hypothetical protein [Tenacibaculum agarivorans]|uniref:hypothetical protein n=1 Tax=Tenacibaculum agarivorans TaxID=1908389 RepID=UPI00094BB7CB|nr:hypothetical protein [Tenacibaculum agarivorans]
MKHPNKQQQKNQEEFLKNCPEDQREFHARMFRLGNVAYRYHTRSKDFEPTKELFNEWLANMPDRGFADVMKEKGFEEAKTAAPFTRFVMEKNDIGYDEFLKAHLSEDDYAYHLSMKEKLND